MAFRDAKAPLSITTVVEDGETIMTSGTAVRGRYYTETWEGFYFYGEERNTRSEFELRWYDAEVGGTQLGSHFFRTNAVRPVETSVPVLGPWLEIRFRSLSGTNEVVWRGAHANWTGTLGDQSTSNLLIRQEAVNVNAGATLAAVATRVWPGPAVLQFYTSATAYTMELQYLAEDGMWSTFQFFTNSTTAMNVTHHVNLPSVVVRGRFVNNDAGTRIAHMYLAAPPLAGSQE